MSKNSDTKLISLKGVLSVELNKLTKAIASLKQCINRYATQRKYNDAFEILPQLLCSFEHERALRYIADCISKVRADMQTLLASRGSCPADLIPHIAPLCYARTVLSIEYLNQFVCGTLVKLWGKSEVDALTRSSDVPQFLVHLQPRNALPLEEMHVIAHAAEDALKIDLRWFYEQHPVTTVSAARLCSSRAMGAVRAPPQVRADVAHAPGSAPVGGKGITELPQLPMIRDGDFERMVEYVDERVRGWDAWRRGKEM